MAEHTFYYDGSLCIACRSCQVACKQWNYLPGEKTEFFAKEGGYQNPSDLSPITWTLMKFHEQETQGEVEWLFRRHHCFHCTQAACIEVCPVEPKAMIRHPEFGTVHVDQNLCIGCGACVEACPYGVPHVNYELEKSRKCTGCYDRVANGMLPACAKTCPTKAIRYGDKGELYALAKQRVKELRQAGWPDANVYGPDQLDGLHSIYVLPVKLETYELPAKVEWEYGRLEPIKRKAQEKYAAVLRERGVGLASVAGGGISGALVASGVVAAGLKKLADRKAARAREEAEEQS
ncbi:MAG: 4Fe-4S dicluster domain-containing protein [Candidatus Eisenbacteria sp.]|nr:4Fe-4S dicluster domain-containing protein [Candidatus Eisenbacteria bacterium]